MCELQPRLAYVFLEGGLVGYSWIGGKFGKRVGLRREGAADRQGRGP